MSTIKFDTGYFSQVIKRLMFALNVQMEYEIAALLGFKKDTFSARKKRGAIPEDKIKLLCAERKINFDWVMTGKGEQTNSDKCDHPLHTGVFPKEFDPDLLLQVTDSIDDIVSKKRLSIPKERLTKVTMLAYADAFWRGRNVNREYLEYILEVASFKEGGLSRDRVFIEAASGGLGGGFVIGKQLPESQGWLGGIKVVEITAEKKDNADKVASKILGEFGIKPNRGPEIRARQLKSSFKDIYQTYRHIVIVINDAHLLSKDTLRNLKSIHELTLDTGKLPGIILLGPLAAIITAINSIEDIKQRALFINEKGQLNTWSQSFTLEQ